MGGAKYDAYQRLIDQGNACGNEKELQCQNERVEHSMATKLEPDGSSSIQALQDLVTTLRSEKGCPWDRKQSPETIANYLVEEIFELAEAITVDDTDAIRDELGDVLFQIVFIIELYQQQSRLTLEAVIGQCLNKMIRRHPHVFGSAEVESERQVKEQWRRIKQQEKDTDKSLLESVPSGLPALMRSYRVSERAASTGFDWTSLEGVLAQAESEWAEFKAELLRTDDMPSKKDDIAMEFGDIMFTLANVARIAGIHPETALSNSTRKFIRRFQRMEEMASDRNRSLDECSKEEMEQMWGEAKKEG